MISYILCETVVITLPVVRSCDGDFTMAHVLHASLLLLNTGIYITATISLVFREAHSNERESNVNTME